MHFFTEYGKRRHETLLEIPILLLDEQANKYRALDNWFKTPQGVRVSQAFAAEIGRVSEHLTGKRLLQLGCCGNNTWLPLLKIRHQWLATPCVISHKSTLIASLTMLPVERDSIDCVIAPLTLEAFSHHKNPIDEIDRILKPMGYVIFFGINPFSFWGASLRWGSLACFGAMPATLTSSFTLRNMMLNRGYRQCSLTSFHYTPPVKSEFLIKKLDFFNEMGKMVWPFPAGFYCYIAQKYQHCSPNLLLNVVDHGLLMQQESSLHAIGQWIHE